VARFREDAHSYAGLVQVCRFTGLLDASLAAHERAVQLDPGISTSVPHTHFARCDYRTVVECYAATGRLTRGYLDAAAWACVGAASEIKSEISERLAGRKWPPLFEALLSSLLCAIRNDANGVKAISCAQDLSDDPESALYFSRHLAWCGCSDLAIRLLRQSVSAGIAIPSMMERDPWLRSLQGDPAFRALKRDVDERHEHANEVFRAAGGARLLAI